MSSAFELPADKVAESTPPPLQHSADPKPQLELIIGGMSDREATDDQILREENAARLAELGAAQRVVEWYRRGQPPQAEPGRDAAWAAYASWMLRDDRKWS